MTDPQMMTLALAIVIPVSMLVVRNSRITDFKETLRAEIGQLRSDLLGGTAQMEGLMESRFDSIDHKLDEILRSLAKPAGR
jgi:hypothetical protein